MMEPTLQRLAVHKFLNYRVAGEEAGYLHLSLLMDDCLKRGKGLLEGGVRYLNAASEVFGIISAADSLTAIKKMVFEKQSASGCRQRPNTATTWRKRIKWRCASSTILPR